MIFFEEYSFSYPTGITALQGISLHIEPGTITVLCGRSGTGKSTLLRLMKDSIAPVGCSTGKKRSTLQEENIGIVFQNPDVQLVCPCVMDELAFVMENRGMKPDEMRQRMAEIVCYFGLEPLLHLPMEQLSGGQKQLISLAAALVFRPSLLLLDEPTSQLDPLSARAFWEMLLRLHRDFNTTIVVAEHRLEYALPVADWLILLEEGRICHQGPSRGVIDALWESGTAEHLLLLPTISVCAKAAFQKVVLSPSEFSALLPQDATSSQISACPVGKYLPAMEMSHVSFSYDSARLILRNCSLSLKRGELFCLVGGNAAGKSTLLALLSGILPMQHGTIRTHGSRIGYMPQQADAFFQHETVAQELPEGADLSLFDLEPLLQRHPYDLSGGEKQRVILTALLGSDCDVLLLDEPTKGMDFYAKQQAGEALRQTGKTVCLVTHDLEFAALYADRCGMLFDGAIAYCDAPASFFAKQLFYTTPVRQAAGEQLSQVLTGEDVMKQCGIPKPHFLQAYHF